MFAKILLRRNWQISENSRISSSNCDCVISVCTALLTVHSFLTDGFIYSALKDIEITGHIDTAINCSSYAKTCKLIYVCMVLLLYWWRHYLDLKCKRNELILVQRQKPCCRLYTLHHEVCPCCCSKQASKQASKQVYLYRFFSISPEEITAILEDKEESQQRKELVEKVKSEKTLIEKGFSHGNGKDKRISVKN
ncbi:hypothetical protein P5673_026773 [Acropora cervicornis]|uniref:Uncharacterized protein n=1 Tax=Acropora cervicornis TaxID=6130 RepID=A0AAD9Q0S9_ACRCE|nr:hypothetical protein P5673_026773 [Acropora cervicornis]